MLLFFVGFFPAEAVFACVKRSGDSSKVKDNKNNKNNNENNNNYNIKKGLFPPFFFFLVVVVVVWFYFILFYFIFCRKKSTGHFTVKLLIFSFNLVISTQLAKYVMR